MTNEYRKFAIEIAEQAGEIIRTNFVLGMKKEWKSDNTPLTETDLAINRLLVDSIKNTFPAHGILTEEGEDLSGNREYVWVGDPIDGTTGFSHGYPTFAFSLALTKNGESILGVICDPVLNRIAVAEKGKGAFLNGQPITVSTAQSLKKALINVDTDTDITLIRLRERVIKEQAYAPNFYTAIYPSLLVAAGEFVATIYGYNKPWDGAAVKIIVEEAGGKVTDIYGNEQRYDQKLNGFVASNGILHERIIKLIKQCKAQT
jgi:myo-inositol-1(or 4)-monophosphatase